MYLYRSSGLLLCYLLKLVSFILLQEFKNYLLLQVVIESYKVSKKCLGARFAYLGTRSVYLVVITRNDCTVQSRMLLPYPPSVIHTLHVK